ncbi:unnamed protein product [Rhizophagus irregularis]|nr:unnamed protein product [Rhizophagus irregularis]
MHSNPSKLWTVPHQDTIDENIEELTNNLENMNITSEANLECNDWEVFISGWALQQRQKIREPVKRIPIHIKQLLEIMFHVRTANPGKKMTAAEMRSELLQRAKPEFCEIDICQDAAKQNLGFL